MFDALPPEIVSRIYQFDSTFRDAMDKVLPDIRVIGSLWSIRNSLQSRGRLGWWTKRIIREQSQEKMRWLKTEK